MYSLVLDGQQGDGLTALMELACTRHGRRDLLALLGPRQSQEAA
jgi:hypothetical protein